MLALLLSTLLSPALAAGGGGLVLHRPSLDQPAPDAPAPHEMRCVGGVGFVVGDSGWRLGGEGHACGGPAADMAFGGMQLGKQRQRRLVYTGWTVGLGGGALAVDGYDTQLSTSTFAYARPTVNVGLPLGIGAVEAGAWLMLPLVHVYEHRLDPSVRSSNLVSGGLQVSFLLGSVGKRRSEPEPAVVRAPPPPPTPAVVVETETFSFDEILIPEDDDPRPLAITEPGHPGPLE